MPFFDFHVHPLLKSIFSEDDPQARPPLQKLTPWQKIDESNMAWIHKVLELDKILRSQANLAQLQSEHCNLSCVVLYAPEDDFVDVLLEYSKKNFLKKLKVYIQEPKLEKLLATSHYETLCNEDLVALQDFRLEIVRQSATYQPTDTQKLYLVFSVEGCHTLSSTPRVDLTNPNSFRLDDILKNLDELRAKLPIISLNLVHLTQSHLSNHAFGTQIGSRPHYYPVGKGLSSQGAKVVEHCYQNKIMIDVKHLGIVARTQFYALRNSPSLQAIQQPIVCSHAGFAGISYKEIANYIIEAETKGTSIKITLAKPLKYGKVFGRPSFNASSINLFDEDIIEILRSGGMIGFSLDKRILGYTEYEEDDTNRDEIPNEVEYISAQEKTFFLQNFTGKLKAIDVIAWDEMKQGELLGLVDYQTQHFIMHIFHLIEVAKRNQYDVAQALKQVCIGSDYEGIINPMLACPTIESLASFQQSFEKQFGYLAQDANIALPANFDIKAFSNDLFYENGKNFVLQRVDMLQASPSPTPPLV